MRLVAVLLCAYLVVWGVIKLIHAAIAVLPRLLELLAAFGVGLAIFVAIVLIIPAVGMASRLLSRRRARTRTERPASPLSASNVPVDVREPHPTFKPPTVRLSAESPPSWAHRLPGNEAGTSSLGAVDLFIRFSPNRQLGYPHSQDMPVPKPSAATPPIPPPTPSRMQPTQTTAPRKSIITITLVVEPAEHLPSNIASAGPVQYVELRSVDVMLIGSANKIKSTAIYRVKQIEIHAEKFVKSLSPEAHAALRDLVRDPSDRWANARFRSALPDPEMESGPTQATLTMRHNAEIDLGDCEVMVVGDNTKEDITSRITIAHGRLPISRLLKNNAQLTCEFAKMVGNPNPAEQASFKQELTHAVKRVDGLTLIRDDQFQPGVVHGPTVEVIGHAVRGDVMVASVGGRTDVQERALSSVGSVSVHMASERKRIARILRVLDPSDATAPKSPHAVDLTREGPTGIGSM